MAQNRTILVPIQVQGAPFQVDDSNEHFAKSFRWFIENESDSAVTEIKRLVATAGYVMSPQNYYVVVTNYMDSYSPIGVIHDDQTEYFNTRFYGLEKENLYYVYISRKPGAPSFLSVLATAKSSPFQENLLTFLNFIGVLGTESLPASTSNDVWIDIRRFNIPSGFQKFSDLSFLVKKDLSDESTLAAAVFDNSTREKWSYGVALGLTSVSDVDIVVGSDGRIIVQPKPESDVAVFGVINYHFWPIDTKAPTLGNSIHALAGLRIGTSLEPLVGIGGGVSLGVIDLHAFVGYSLEFANELNADYEIGQLVNKEENPFKTKLRGKPRFGLEVRFP